MCADEMDDDAMSDGGDDELTQEDHGVSRRLRLIDSMLIFLQSNCSTG